MRPTVVGLALFALLLALSVSAQAQKPTKLPRVGYLTGTYVATSSTQAFLRGLRELGYTEGENIVIEWRAAKEVTTAIPIVMAQTDDPVASGFVASLAQPGGNITGLATLAPELSGKRLEILKEVVPKLSRVAVFGTSNSAGNAPVLNETKLVATALGIGHHYIDVIIPNDIEAAFQAAGKARADAGLWLVSGSVDSAHRANVAEIAAKHRLPTIYERVNYVSDGGLMSYGVNLDEMYRRAATYVDKILKGRKPADLPVEQPTKFEFVVNLKAAKAIT